MAWSNKSALAIFSLKGLDNLTRAHRFLLLSYDIFSPLLYPHNVICVYIHVLALCLPSSNHILHAREQLRHRRVNLIVFILNPCCPSTALPARHISQQRTWRSTSGLRMTRGSITCCRSRSASIWESHPSRGSTLVRRKSKSVPVKVFKDLVEPFFWKIVLISYSNTISLLVQNDQLIDHCRL